LKSTIENRRALAHDARALGRRRSRESARPAVHAVLGRELQKQQTRRDGATRRAAGAAADHGGSGARRSGKETRPKIEISARDVARKPDSRKQNPPSEARASANSAVMSPAHGVNGGGAVNK
jgi:hypothetical protein